MSYRKKVIDIFPPDRAPARTSPSSVAHEYVETNPKKSSSLLLKGIGGIIVLVLVAGVALHAFFANASVVVTPQMRPIEAEQTIEVSEEGGELAIRTFQTEKTLTKAFPATGSSEEDAHAKGMIRVYNEYSSSPQTLVENTRFVSEDGQVFRSTSRISVPGKRTENGRTIPGTADVEVIAAEPGPEYNISSSNFSLPGLVGTALYTSVYAEALEDFHGGAVNAARIVTADDIENAHDSIMSELQGQVRQELQAQIPGTYAAVEDSLSLEELDAFSLVKEGSEIEEFNYTAKVKGTMFAVLEEEGRRKAKEMLSEEMESSETIHEESLQVAYETLEAGDRTATIRVSAAADVFHTLDTTSLKSQLRGVSEERAARILEEYPNLTAAKVSVWPFWRSSIPDNENKIEIDFSMEGEE